MSPKSDLSTLKPPFGSEISPEDIVAHWSEALDAYPLYAALATQFDLGPLPHSPGVLPPDEPTPEILRSDLRWLDDIDERVRAFQIRQLPPETLNAGEQGLRAFLQRQLRRPDKTTADRDKIDLLLVQYFALCAPEELYRKEIHLKDVATVLRPVLHGEDATPLEWCAPLDQILNKIAHCESLRDMMEGGLLEQGRLLKESAGAMFYDPAALVAFCRFNFLLRRAFIRLLHADLSAVRHAVATLEVAGVRTVDCRRAGFSAAEKTSQVRYYTENWKQPFHKDYTASSVNRVFEQLLALRADLEEAVGRTRSLATPFADSKNVAGPVSASALAAASVEATRSNATAASPQKTDGPLLSTAPDLTELVTESAANRVKKTSRDKLKPTGPAGTERCLEAIWDQLTATPPSKPYSMATVLLQDSKVLLSSWEVAAFMADGDQEADDLRRAVVARALLAVATDQRKRSGDWNQLASALTIAKSEIAYFQWRIELAKKAKNTEAAVNLGISTKRLLSFVEEAEKLQP
ncbi:MAG: hypothetical protein WB630_21635 [Candidatus Acidiferrales bacterium]